MAEKREEPQFSGRLCDHQRARPARHCQRVQRAKGSGLLTVTIVGGGTIGVELAAELHSAVQVLGSYGFENINPEKDLQIVGSFFIEGQVAKLMYWALHKQHQLALGGVKKRR